jgi:cyclophilin family peptidyl-prolyl cis-trans isomerase
MKKIVVLFGVLCAWGWGHASTAPPVVAKEHVVFSTDYGDLVFALYPEVAPKHVAQILKLARLGAYDSTHAFRVIPNFIVQFADVQNRALPLSAEQHAADQPLPAEFSATLKHVKGRLSMARWEAPDSATSSFSIVLNDAPHLDEKYTLFGHLESGGSVVNRMLGVPRDGETPKTRIRVHRAFVIDDIGAWYAQHAPDPASVIGTPIPQPLAAPVSSSVSADTHTQKPSPIRWMGYILLAMVMLSVLSFALFERLSKRQLLSLHMLNALIGAFALFIIATPLGHEYPWLAGVIFILLPILFKFMNRFESAKS